MPPGAFRSGPAHLGVIDWGIGGLGLLGLLDEGLPDVPVTYWSDTGAVPYGLQSTTALTRRLRRVVAELADRGCTEVVLACNAASTVVGRLRSGAVPVQGIIEHGVAAVPADLAGVVGVVGGRRTIASGQYRKGLAAPDRTVTSRVAQPLSAHIEAGRTGAAAFTDDLERIVAPLRGAAAVVLACTHYPAAAPAFAAALPGTRLIDPAEHLAASLVRRHRHVVHPAGGVRTYLTTGDLDAMRRGACAAWAHELPTIEMA